MLPENQFFDFSRRLQCPLSMVELQADARDTIADEDSATVLPLTDPEEPIHLLNLF